MGFVSLNEGSGVNSALMSSIIIGCFVGFVAWFLTRYLAAELQKISQDQDISTALFEALETQNLIEGEAAITIVPRNSPMLNRIMAASQSARAVAAK